jgi:transposase
MQYAPRGGEPYAPEILLGLLFYGYATGVFSSRKIEKA